MTSSGATDSGGDEILLERLADDFVGRYRRGDRPTIQEYVDRLPELAEEIRALLPAMVELECVLEVVETPAETAPAPYPEFRDFVIVREIGRGGMGVVYEAEQVSLGRRVALKVLTQRMLRDARQRLRFEREAKAAARLHHTNIVPVFGFGEHDGTPYYVMQCIEGAGLDEVVAEVVRLERGGVSATLVPSRTATVMARSLVSGRFAHDAATECLDDDARDVQPGGPVEPVDGPPVASISGGSVTRPAGHGSGVVSAVTQPRPDPAGGSSETRRLTYWQGVARLGVQVGAALDYAHKSGVLHRDIKPSNLLLDARGTVWVTDFGLAKADDQQSLTLTGDIVGTLRYMPPEAFDGKADARGDTYSLGLTLYELVALRPAFDSRDRNTLIRQVTGDEPPRLGRLRPGVPRDLETVVHKAIEKDPELRYATAGELAADLQRFLDDEPIRARRASLAERVARWTRRNKAWAAVIAGAAVLLVVLSVISTVAASYFRGQAEKYDRLAREEQRQRGIASRSRDEAEAARTVAERRGTELRDHLYRAEMNLAAQAAAAPGGVARVAELVNHWRGGRPEVRGWEWTYFNGLAHRARLVLGGSGQAVRSVAWSPDGRHLASAGDDGSIRVWDADRGRELRAWPAHTGGVRSVAWSPDGDRIASGGADWSIRVWDAADGRLLRARFAHGVPVTSVAWSPDGTRLASGGDGDGFTKVWDAAPGGAPARRAGPSSLMGLVGGDALRSWKAPSDNAYAVAWSPDGRHLASAHHDERVRVWDIDGTSPPREFGGARYDVSAVAWSPDGCRLASAGTDHRVRVWDAGSGRVLRELTGHLSAVHGLAWSPDGRHLASAGNDQTVGVWDPASEAEPIVLQGHGGHVLAVAWSPEGRRLASAGEDGSVRLWEPDSSPGVLERQGQGGSLYDVTFSPDGSRLAIASAYTTVRVYDREAAGLAETLAIRTTGYRTAWSPDGSRLASGNGDGRIAIWDAADGKKRLELKWPGEVVRALAWSPDGRRLAWGTWDPFIRIWSLDGEPGPATWRTQGSATQALAWSPDGSRLASGGGIDGTIFIWDPAAGRPARRLIGDRAAVSALAWSPDGSRLASAGETDVIRIWDTGSGASVAMLRGHISHIAAVAWSPDGSRLASGGADHTVRLWDTGSWREILALADHHAPVSTVAWSPDGRRLASGGDDRTLLVRDADPTFAPARSPAPTPAAIPVSAPAPAPVPDEPDRPAPDDPARWWTAGPFDPARGEPDLRADPIGPPWEPAEVTADGRIELGLHASPGHAGAAYALHRVWSPAAARLALKVGASGPVQVRLGDRVLLDAKPRFGTVTVEEVRAELPAGWSTLAFRVEAGGDRPALRAWLEGDPDRARDKVDALLVRGRWAEADAAIEAEAAARPGEAGALYSIAARAAHRRAARLRDRGKDGEAAEAGRMAALWFDRLRAARPGDAEADRHFAEFLADGLDPAGRRTILRPTSLKSAGGTTLTRLDDGSVLASGTHPEFDEYTIEGVTDVPGIRAIRLEVLPDPSFPANGPGRVWDGNFALSEVSVRAGPADEPGRAAPVPIVRASASMGDAPWARDRQGPGKVIDGRNDTWWEIWSIKGRPHALWLDTAQPLGGPGRIKLAVTLSFRGPGRCELGRFRLAVQSVPGPGPALAPRWGRLVASEAGAWPALATVRAFRGEWAAARDELLRDGRAPDGRSPVPDLLLSLVQDQLGRDDLAAAAYERAVGRSCLAGSAVDVLEFAIEVAARRVARHPDDARLRVHRARWMIACDRWAEQKLELREADRLAPDRWTGWAFVSEQMLEQRAKDAARDGDWPGALRALARLRALRPDDRDPWWFSALVLAHARDQDGLRRLGREMLDRFQKTGDAGIAERTAQVNLLPTGSYQTSQSAALIERSIAANPGEPWHRLTRGTAAYRAGRLDDAVRDLNECMAQRVAYLPQAAGFVLAMVHPRPGAPTRPGASWRGHAIGSREITREDRERDWLIGIFVDLLRRDAEELIEGIRPKPPK